MLRSIIANIVTYLLVTINLFGSESMFKNYEDTLRRLSLSVFENECDSHRIITNDRFKLLLKEVLKLEGSFDYPFDSLVTVSRIVAPDRSFRILTWHLPMSGGRFQYFGIFQTKDHRPDFPNVFVLQDNGTHREGIEYQTLGPGSWYGAVYLDIVHKRYNQKDYFVLLGWRGDNPLTRKRIIEPIKMDDYGAPVFGQTIFRYGDNNRQRVIFEYSARVSMNLSFARHALKPGGRVVDMIVFDRLHPLQPYLEGRYQFYVPEGNIFDAFVFRQGKWEFTPDVDARAPARPPLPRRNR